MSNLVKSKFKSVASKGGRLIAVAARVTKKATPRRHKKSEGK